MRKIKLTPFVYREINPKIQSNKKFTKNVDANKFLTGFPLNKYWTFDFIETISDYIDFSEVKTILDLGSRDGYQSVEFRNWFPNAKIIAFEANPNQINLMHDVTKGYNIDIVPKAVGNYNGKTSFFLCSGNVGGSSLLKIGNHTRSRTWYQKEIEVDVVRVDDWCKENNIVEVDLLWVDVQGAEKIVFEGCGDILNNVKAICTEVEIAHMYQDSVLKNELDNLLLDKGFVELITFHMTGHEIDSLDEISDTIGECDVTYVNKKYLNGKV
jgi:FkbM family methyltransferase